MGMLFFLIQPDASDDLCIAQVGGQTAPLFYYVAKLLEARVTFPCGIVDESDIDQFSIHGAEFIAFIDGILAYKWEGEGLEYFYGWLEFAAGLVEIITIEPWTMERSRGLPLRPVRYQLGKTGEQIYSSRKEALVAAGVQFPSGESHPRFDHLTPRQWDEVVDGFWQDGRNFWRQSPESPSAAQSSPPANQSGRPDRVRRLPPPRKPCHPRRLRWLWPTRNRDAPKDGPAVDLLVRDAAENTVSSL